MWNPLSKFGRLDNFFGGTGVMERSYLDAHVTCACACVMHENERNRAHLPLLIMQDFLLQERKEHLIKRHDKGCVWLFVTAFCHFCGFINPSLRPTRRTCGSRTSRWSYHTPDPPQSHTTPWSGTGGCFRLLGMLSCSKSSPPKIMFQEFVSK